MLIQLFGAPEFQEMVFYLTFLSVLLRTHVVSAATGIDQGLQHNDGNILTRVDLELLFPGEQRGRIQISTAEAILTKVMAECLLGKYFTK